MERDPRVVRADLERVRDLRWGRAHVEVQGDHRPLLGAEGLELGAQPVQQLSGDDRRVLARASWVS